MGMQRDPTVDEVNRVIVRLNGDNAGTFIDAVELGLTCRVESPAVFRLVQIKSRYLRIHMISDENAVECHIFFFVLCKRSGPKQGDDSASADTPWIKCLIHLSF